MPLEPKPEGATLAAGFAQPATITPLCLANWPRL